jgi:wyosine [tRNA(Phe)-imidazoG37] synthetase (radical SAM superfamily)
MKYIYGPVQSRRLGFSLGLSLTPHKTCNFDCVYCQLGKTQQLTLARGDLIKVSEITQEVAVWLQNNPEQAKALNYITLSGSGEPTLNTGVGELIAWLKKNTLIPVCVITNGSTLADPAVRSELLAADLVVPSLDAATEPAFKAVNRPHADIKLEDIIAGLESFRKEYRGRIWLEIMFVKGKNDGAENIRQLTECIGRIHPDKIQLNSPVRCTAEPDALPLDEKKLLKIKEAFGDKAEIL